jgi:hypothetical protein
MGKISRFSLLIFILLLNVVIVASADSPSDTKYFLVEVKVLIDNKVYNPTNISLSIHTNSSAPSYAFNLSSQNFNRNVTVALRLFAWYNGQCTVGRQAFSLSTLNST